MKNFWALKNEKMNIEYVINNNLVLYPFNYNLLHIIAILDELKDFDLNMIDWNIFKKMKFPIYVFLFLDYQGNTCFDILLKKKNKTFLKYFFEALFNSLENDIESEFKNNFYMKLKLFRYDFNSQRKSFIILMNELMKLFGEDTEILNRFFSFSFKPLNFEVFSNEFMYQELEYPIFTTTNSFGWLRNKNKIKDVIKQKMAEKTHMFSCIKRFTKHILLDDNNNVEIICSLFFIKDISYITKDTVELWENILKLKSTNKIFEDKNLEILIHYKWESYARSYYLKEFFQFVFFFLLYLINFIYIFQNRYENEITS